MYKWGPSRMRMILKLSWHVCVHKMATGWNAPQGEEKVRSECRIDTEFSDLGGVSQRFKCT